MPGPPQHDRRRAGTPGRGAAAAAGSAPAAAARAARFDVVLSEAVLLRVVGGAVAMAEQLRHLVEASRLPHVSIRVAPLAAGPHDVAIAGSFVLLDFPLGIRVDPEPPVVYRESLTGTLYLDRPAELAAYEKVWASLDALALGEEVHHG
ncbi:DUF5753 domain-containing protein [Micromonospora sp. NBC_01655]|uniref:DUF5753 domain-containing protein n=1 Tax=Micromonospora sp. NBC_01655 TaxID=2975983 RepID=UPI00338D36B8